MFKESYNACQTDVLINLKFHLQSETHIYIR